MIIIIIIIITNRSHFLYFAIVPSAQDMDIPITLTDDGHKKEGNYAASAQRLLALIFILYLYVFIQCM